MSERSGPVLCCSVFLVNGNAAVETAQDLATIRLGNDTLIIKTLV